MTAGNDNGDQVLVLADHAQSIGICNVRDGREHRIRIDFRCGQDTVPGRTDGHHVLIDIQGKVPNILLLPDLVRQFYRLKDTRVLVGHDLHRTTGGEGLPALVRSIAILELGHKRVAIAQDTV